MTEHEPRGWVRVEVCRRHGNRWVVPSLKEAREADLVIHLSRLKVVSRGGVVKLSRKQTADLLTATLKMPDARVLLLVDG